MNGQKGSLSIESKNIFNILKKWLYTEQDIVFRELISNASDAIEKRGIDTGLITVTIDSDQQQIIISDNGIGMTQSEVDQYINQIAFSGAAEYIRQHDALDTDAIIGHFGVGFYSAFMLADHVAIETRSHQEDALPVRWDCRGDMTYEMKIGTRDRPGTDVILYLPISSPYLSDPKSVANIIKRYFMFLKTEIRMITPEHDHVMINEPDPIWKQPDEVISESLMQDFYRSYFDDPSNPLFWVKFQSPDIGLRGILFFRDTKNGTAELDGTIKVYNRGVYVGENLPAMIPKFVNLQSGIIECDHLPLVVSRSTVRDQDSEQLTGLIYETLSQEVTIALNRLFEEKRDQYEAFWPNLNAFVKYGVLQDKIFASVMTRKVIFEDLYGRFKTIKEYLEDGSNTHPSTVYYASDKLEQAHYIEIFKKCGLNALLFDHVIDQPFLRRQEITHQKIEFFRIDSNIQSLFQGNLSPSDAPKVDKLTHLIRQTLGERLANMTLKITAIEQKGISTLIINDERSRRMADMMEIYGVIKPTDHHLKEIESKTTLLVNLNNPIILRLLKHEDENQIHNIIHHLFDMALMSQGTLGLEYVESFIQRNESFLEQILMS